MNTATISATTALRRSSDREHHPGLPDRPAPPVRVEVGQAQRA
jgi:hypothetical protein